MALFNCKVGGSEGSSFPSPVRFNVGTNITGEFGDNKYFTTTSSLTIPEGVFKRALFHNCTGKQGSTTLAKDTIVTLDATKTVSVSVSKWTNGAASASGYVDFYVD